MLLFSVLTLILTAATVWGGRVLLRNSETLIFAVGDANGPEARFSRAPELQRSAASQDRPQRR
jgi:hypothetical protein